MDPEDELEGADPPDLELEDDVDGQEDEDADALGEFEEGEDPDSEDHGEQDPAGADEGQAGQPDQVRTQGRGQGRIQRLSAALKEERARARRLEEQLGRGGGNQPSAAELARAQEAEQARLAMMSPEERIEYRMNQQEHRHRLELAQVRFETADAADKTNFDALCRSNPTASRLRDRVETVLAAERARGTNYPRETVLKFVIGEQALKGAPRAKRRDEKAAEGQRQRQAGRPGSGRSDVGNSGGRKDERQARRERLENLEI